MKSSSLHRHPMILFLHLGTHSISRSEDALTISLQELAASSPVSNEAEDLPATVSANTQRKLEKYLQLYNSGHLTLAQSSAQFDQLGAFLSYLLSQPDLSSLRRHFSKALSARLSPILAPQQMLSIGYDTLGVHFLSINSCKVKATKLLALLTDLNK